jgi:hypothetical protein
VERYSAYSEYSVRHPVPVIRVKTNYLCLFPLFYSTVLTVTYLSVGYQAVYHSSATGAGVRLLPFILVQVATLIASSRIIPKIGRFKWVIFTGPCILSLGCGLLYSIKYGTSEAHLYGYQVLLGEFGNRFHRFGRFGHNSIGQGRTA